VGVARFERQSRHPHPARLHFVTAGDPPHKGEGKKASYGAGVARGLPLSTTKALTVLANTVPLFFVSCTILAGT
jgi:hypothetical protein